MQIPADIQDYLELHATELGERILSSFPPLQSADDELSPLLSKMLRQPYLVQGMAAASVSKCWQMGRNANVIAECGAGKTLIALASMFLDSACRSFSGLVMAPPHLVDSVACRVSTNRLKGVFANRCWIRFAKPCPLLRVYFRDVQCALCDPPTVDRAKPVR